MSQPLLKAPPMSAEEYLAWHVTQDERYEYVNGAPQLKHVRWDGPRMMVGATQAHMRLSLRTAMEIERQLDGRCRALIADGKIFTPNGNYRYADVAVDCGPYSANSTTVTEPVLVVEVWSKSTRWLDLTLKLDDYRSITSIQSILFLSQDRPSGQLWTRHDNWVFEDLEGLEAQAAIPALWLTLALRAIYEGLDLG